MFNKSFLKKIKDLLEIQKNEISMRATQIDDIDSDGDETDEIQANFLIEMSKQLNSRDRDKIIKINTALNKIAENKFGLCDDCEDEISEKRLLINPYCSTCISCAEEREKDSRQKRRV